MRDVVPFPDQMRGDEHRLSALRFEAKGLLLKPFSPARIETQSRFVEQQHRRIGEQKQGEAEPLTRPAGKLVSPHSCEVAQSGKSSTAS